MSDKTLKTLSSEALRVARVLTTSEIPQAHDHVSGLQQFSSAAVYWRSVNNARDIKGNLAWDGLVSEDYFTAMAETDPDERREKLTALAATALAAASQIPSPVIEEAQEAIEEDAE